MYGINYAALSGLRFLPGYFAGLHPALIYSALSGQCPQNINAK